jgi:3-deoxy-D-manno-octulosonic-acid transferase
MVTGNMKFDPLPENDDNRTDTRRLTISPYILAASTHPGEERPVIRAYMKCARAHPDLKLVIAPRHVCRSKGIKALARAEGLRAVMWSQCHEASGAQCVVVDCLGVLAELYRHAEFAFVGKSLRAGGGQNFLEAVQADCPVLTGPCTGNFDSMLAPFLAADAVWQLADPAELAEAFAGMVPNKEKRSFMAREARRILEENSGATEHTVREILSKL